MGTFLNLSVAGFSNLQDENINHTYFLYLCGEFKRGNPKKMSVLEKITLYMFVLFNCLCLALSSSTTVFNLK